MVCFPVLIIFSLACPTWPSNYHSIYFFDMPHNIAIHIPRTNCVLILIFCTKLHFYCAVDMGDVMSPYEELCSITSERIYCILVCVTLVIYAKSIYMFPKTFALSIYIYTCGVFFLGGEEWKLRVLWRLISNHWCISLDRIIFRFILLNLSGSEQWSL